MAARYVAEVVTKDDAFTFVFHADSAQELGNVVDTIEDSLLKNHGKVALWIHPQFEIDEDTQ